MGVIDIPCKTLVGRGATNVLALIGGLMKKILLMGLVCCFFEAAAQLALAEELPQSGVRLPEVRVEGAALQAPQSDSLPAKPLPEVQDGKIYSSKKTTVTELKNLPNITTNNYRQALSQTPGLITSEVSNEAFTSFSYRGLGDPHESFNINLLRDGVPISADLFGYPANYYQPPLESIERLEFIRGGSGLLYGPQVGGALNYVSREPKQDAPLAFETKQVFGERSLYSTYNQISGSSNGVGFLGFFHHRESDGYRKENSDYVVNNADIKATFESSERAVWTVGVDAYDADHGEAGGLALKSGPGLASYDEDRSQTTTKFDRLRIERYAPTLRLDYDVDAATTLHTTAFGGYYRRYSRRQSPGTAETFGGFYDGGTNTIVLQEFRSLGADARVAHDWRLGEKTQTLTVGAFVYGSDSPFKEERGDTPYSNAGELRKKLGRNTFNAALFAENRFVFGDLKVVPGLRFENISQSIDEDVNVTSEGALRSENDYRAVLLPGLGVAYDLQKGVELYANASTSFKPKTFQDAVPLNTGDTISEDLRSARAKNFEVGARGKAQEWLRYDVSAFSLFFDDQFGRVGSNIQNVGNSRTLGVDAAGQVGTLSLLDRTVGTDLKSRLGELNLYANASFLDAEFVQGPQDGKTPQYAPHYLLRSGLVYHAHDSAKIALLGTFVGEHFGDDSNSDERRIPSYAVWDLTGEVALWSNQLSVVAGVQNLFDKEYYARVRSNGVDPALPRNVYGGVVLRF